MNIRHLSSLEPRQLFAAGDPDDSFGHFGVAIAPAVLETIDISDVKTTRDGKLLAGIGYQFSPATPALATADFVRFNSDGTVDTTFGSTGYVDSVFNTVRRVAVRSDGKFYALASLREWPEGKEIEPGSEAVVNGKDNWFIARFLPSGQLDRSFGRRGKVGIHLDRTLSEAGAFGGMTNQSSFLDTDGRLTLLANFRPHGRGRERAAVFRYDSSGAFDPTFNNGQPLSLRTADDTWTDPSIALGKSGDVFVSAVRGFRRQKSTVVKHFNNDGSVDTAFGRQGLVTAAVGESRVPTSAVAKDGSLFVSDSLTQIDRDGQYVTTKRLWKFAANGAPDATFAPWSVAHQYETASMNAVLPTDDGGAILDDFRLYRLKANGKADTTFGNVRFASERPILADNRVYGIVTRGAAAELNRDEPNTPHYGVNAISLGGTDPGPVTISHRQLTLTGTSDGEFLDFFPGVTARKVTVFSFSRGLWGREVPLAAFDSVEIFGGAGNDSISVYVDTLYDRTVTVHGGAGDDYIDSRVPGVIAYGDEGDDELVDVIRKDGKP